MQYPPHPAFFTLSSLPFDYAPDAPKPTEWLRFLKSIWGNDPASINTLQEMFGYYLTSDTTQQKIFMLIGPKRSGKDTIARVLRELLGHDNIAGPTLASLSQNFGVALLISKKLAVISDARLGSRTDQHAITERLLAISGEDCLTIPRKYLTDYTAKLDVRFLMLTNELPRIADASGALASRFIVLTLTESFFGNEDHALTNKLLKELPAILNWSIPGWQRLIERGYFEQPDSSLELLQELNDLTSPMSAFIRDRCVINPAATVERNRLYVEWKDWCEEHGRKHSGTLETFGRDLRATVPNIKRHQPRQGNQRLNSYRGITLKSTWHTLAHVSDNCTRKENFNTLFSVNHNASAPVSSCANEIEGEI